MELNVRSWVESFQRDRDLEALPLEEAFETFAGFCVLSAYCETEFAPDTFRTGGGNDLGIDAFGIVINGGLMHDSSEVRAAVENSNQLDVHFLLIQAKTSSKFETKVVSDLADNLRHVFNREQLVYPASHDITDLRECIAAIYETPAKLFRGRPKLEFSYVTTGEQVAEMVQDKARAAEQTLLSLGIFETVDFRCVTVNDLRELYRQATEAVSASITMPKRIAMPKAPGVEQALLGLLPANELVRKVLTDSNGNIRKALFNDNVRDFQGYNEVNSQIRETLRDSQRSQRLAVLHNGITIVARQMHVVGDEVVVKDFQIVNGCQTCHVLFAEREGLTDDVQVPVRLVHSENESVITDIVAATNRQMAIDEEDLSVREVFHKRLEEYFIVQEAPRRLYYERRSKQYSSNQAIEKTRIVGRPQLIRAFAAMFLQDAAGSGRYVRLLETRKGELFQADQLPITYYTAAATSYRLEWLIRNSRISATNKPYRYHLLSGIMMRVLRTDVIPKHPKAISEQCAKILDVVWDATEAEKLVVDLLPSLHRAVEKSKPDNVPVGELVRTHRFAESFKQELGIESRPGRKRN